VNNGSEITREARLENLPALLHFISGACARAGASTSDEFAVKLAVEEACVNVMTHGYAGREPGPISVTFRADPDRFVVTIADFAAPFQPETLPEPDLTSGWQEREIGGLGWWLIRKMVDNVEYESRPGSGNRLTLVKRREAAREATQGGRSAD
jgi:serine/threonine-protein kinase RsbW